VVEGAGHDLHWTLLRLQDQSSGLGADAQAVRVKRGDFIYIPPFTIHQHVASEEARLIVISNRIVKEMGSTVRQIEPAPGSGS